MATDRYLQVQTTVASEADARRIACAVVEKRLAACAQVSGPIQSYFWWQGCMEESQEWQCHMKTRRDLFVDLQRYLLELHPYETPEIIAVPIVAMGTAYQAWLDRELAKKL